MVLEVWKKKRTQACAHIFPSLLEEVIDSTLKSHHAFKTPPYNLWYMHSLRSCVSDFLDVFRVLCLLTKYEHVICLVVEESENRFSSVLQKENSSRDYTVENKLCRFILLNSSQISIRCE